MAVMAVMAVTDLSSMAFLVIPFPFPVGHGRQDGDDGY